MLWIIFTNYIGFKIMNSTSSMFGPNNKLQQTCSCKPFSTKPPKHSPDSLMKPEDDTKNHLVNIILSTIFVRKYVRKPSPIHVRCQANKVRHKLNQLFSTEASYKDINKDTRLDHYPPAVISLPSKSEEDYQLRRVITNVALV